MRTFSRYLLESPIDELPPTINGKHPHITFDDYEVKKERKAKLLKDNAPPIHAGGTHDRFASIREYEDPRSGVKTTIDMVHRTPGSTREMTSPHETVGVARVQVSINNQYNDASSESGAGFQMPGDIMKKISVASGHLGHFIGEHTPLGLHTIEYNTEDPKRHALYQHIGRLYPHITFRNYNKKITGRDLTPVKRKPRKLVPIPESYSVDSNYWNMSNINKFIMESPLDELPADVEGPHPHKIHDTYEQEKELSRKNPELGFQSLHIYHDPDNRLNTTILANHLAPGWTGDLPDSLFPYHKYKHIIPSRNAGIAHISTQVKGSFDDKSKSKFHMPGEIIGMIKSSASHVHDFITKHTPLGLHTITYQTKDPKRHALYQHMARLYPHITFKNTDEVAGVKQTSSKALTDSVDTNYWNMSNIRKFILESPIDELPAAVEGDHPHQTWDNYKTKKKAAGHWMKVAGHEAPTGFKTNHFYHDPSTGVATQIKMNHLTPGWTGVPHPSVGVAHVSVSVGGQWGDASRTGSGFQMPGDIMGKIKVSREHIHDFITKYTPHGLHTIEYDTEDPKRHALYQHIATQYPHILFRNTTEVKPVERKPKKPVEVSEPVAIPESYSVDSNYWNMSNINKFILESPIDELPPTIKGEHPHKILDTYREEMESAIRDENWPPQADIGFTTRSIYYDPDREVTSNISMDHATPGWAERRDGNQGVAHVVVGVSGKTNDKSKSKFHMPSEVMGIIDSSHRHLHHFIGENTPRGLHTIEYETKDPKRHALYQHMARLHPHITFRNISKLKTVKRKPKPVAVSESYSVDSNYWNMSNINKFILESPLDELPTAVEGVHPHQTENTYEEEEESAIHDDDDDDATGFTSTHIYQDPDLGIKTHIEMDHVTPGWVKREDRNQGVARCAVEVNGMFGDSSRNGSRFHMPGEIMGKIASSSSHLHDFITKYNPHTVEYSTTDPKRHALYQHMNRHLYPHIWFNNIREVEPVKRKPKKPVEVSESYSKKQMRVANQTSRNSGAIGKKAITPAYVKTITGKKHKILDFGSGRDAAHTKALRKTGRNVTAHEFGANVNKNHNPKALKKKYDTVFASNVLNTSSSRKMLSDTLDQMHSAVAPGGALVANLPLSPRKSVKVDAKHLMRQLMNRFGDVRRVGGTKKAPLFHATGPK